MPPLRLPQRWPSATAASRATRRRADRTCTPSGPRVWLPTPRSRRSSDASPRRIGSRRSCSPSRACSGRPRGRTATGRRGCVAHADDVVAECSARSLQTNEPLRCAALLPALSGIAGPIALLEVGASAGLCLYPDRYSYRYRGGPDLDPADGASAVVLESAISGGPPLRMPDVVWRAGIDLAPLDAADADDRRFLVSLVWPGEEGRAARIEAALEIAAADPPLLVRGDATEPDVLDALVALAPTGATLVITTPGVLPHIPARGAGTPHREHRPPRRRVGLDRPAGPAPRRRAGGRRHRLGWLRPAPRRGCARSGRPARGFRGVARRERRDVAR